MNVILSPNLRKKYDGNLGYEIWEYRFTEYDASNKPLFYCEYPLIAVVLCEMFAASAERTIYHIQVTDTPQSEPMIKAIQSMEFNQQFRLDTINILTLCEKLLKLF